MSDINLQHLKSGFEALTISLDTLKKISGTCCMPERSQSMNKSLTILSELLNDQPKNMDQLQSYITDIETLGSDIGKLYVSCCTDTREPLYQLIFQQLNVAHGKIFQAMGISH